jgi:anti-sigma regulatory factor (Ser/Thr protein kinase)
MFDFKLSLPPDPEAPGAARRALEGLRATLAGDAVDRAMLLVSELVTNSVRHAVLPSGGAIVVRVHATEDLLRTEVTDQGPGFDPALQERRNGKAGGWGLRLVAGLADRWGVEHGDGTTVWFELGRPSPAPLHG